MRALQMLLVFRAALLRLCTSPAAGGKVPADKIEIGRLARDRTRSFRGMVLPGERQDSVRLGSRFGTPTLNLTDDTLLGYECFRSLHVDRRSDFPGGEVVRPTLA